MIPRRKKGHGSGCALFFIGKCSYEIKNALQGSHCVGTEECRLRGRPVIDENYRCGGGFMSKIIVIGCPGAGKSTFARKLRDAARLPLYYLDVLWHKPDHTNIWRDTRKKRVLS